MRPLTEQELVEIEARCDDFTPGLDVTELCRQLACKDVPALLAEVRLRRGIMPGMSDALAQFSFADGTVFYGRYNGTTDLMRRAMVRTESEAWQDMPWSNDPCRCKDWEPVKALSHYGGGFWWKGLACRRHMLFIGPVCPVGPNVERHKFRFKNTSYAGVTLDDLERLLGKLKPETGDLYQRAAQLAKESADTLSDDFQVAAEVEEVFWRLARRRES